MTSAAAGRLAAVGISLAGETESHYLFSRDNLLVLVPRTPEGFGAIGSTGMMTAAGLAFLVWRDGRPFLAAKGSEVPAEPDEVEAIRRFSKELETALRE